MTRVVGSQSNVPDIGDPITSPWPQDTATKLVHTFATVAARDAWANPPNGAVCVTTDTNTTWRRQGGVWVDDIKIASATGNFNTDANGLLTVTLPAGGKWVSAVCISAQMAVHMFATVDQPDGPPGGNVVRWQIRNPTTGATYPSTIVSVTYIITYRTF